MRVDRTGIRERHARIERMTDEYRLAKKRQIIPATANRKKAETMFKDFSPARLATLWMAAVAVIVAGSVVLGADITVSAGALLVAVWLVPPAIVMLVWRGAPPITVAELLYAVNSEKPGRS